MTKEEIINGIAFRIIEEHKKHPTLDWEFIAAAKIYSSFVNEYGRQCFEAGKNTIYNSIFPELKMAYTYDDYLKELEK